MKCIAFTWFTSGTWSRNSLLEILSNKATGHYDRRMGRDIARFHLHTPVWFAIVRVLLKIWICRRLLYRQKVWKPLLDPPNVKGDLVQSKETEINQRRLRSIKGDWEESKETENNQSFIQAPPQDTIILRLCSCYPSSHCRIIMQFNVIQFICVYRLSVSTF